MTILMVGQESQTDKLSSKLNCKTNEICRSLEFNEIELNNLRSYFRNKLNICAENKSKPFFKF